ncbi:MAG: phenylacetate--CoA ligase family protein [Alphaproteobacteria bacterium]
MSERPYWNPEAETLSHAELAQVQLRGVRDVMTRALATETMYGRRLKSAGVDPAKIGSLADFANAVPLTSKDDLRAEMDRTGSALPHLMLPESDIVVAAPSAGTSGRQTFQAFSAADWKINREITSRLQWCCGFRPDDRLYAMVTPFTVFTHILRDAASNIGINWIMTDDHNMANIKRYIDVALSLKPTVMHIGIATLRAMTKIVTEEMGLDRFGGFRIAVASGAEIGAEARQDFRDRVGIEVYELAGQGSDFNLLCTECEHHDGLHWHGEDHQLVEIVDPETGLPVKDGEIGEMVLTDFYRHSTPHIRWRTEDLFYAHPEPCKCGRTVKRFTCLGRVSNRVSVAGRAVYPFEVERSLSRSTEGRNQEFAMVRRGADQDRLVLRLIRPSKGGEVEIGAAIAAHVERDLGVSTEIEFADKLAMVGYKTLRVVDADA